MIPYGYPQIVWKSTKIRTENRLPIYFLCCFCRMSPTLATKPCQRRRDQPCRTLPTSTPFLTGYTNACFRARRSCLNSRSILCFQLCSIVFFILIHSSPFPQRDCALVQEFST